MAVRFDTTAENLKRTTNNPATTSFTAMAWAYKDTHSGFDGVITLGNAADADFYQIGSEEVSNFFQIYNGSAVGIGSTAISTGKWWHFCMTGAGTGASDMTGYLADVGDDDVEVLTLTGRSSTTGLLAIGTGNNSNDDNWNGRVAAVKIWSVVLTQDEIKQERYQILPFRAENLNTFLPMEIADGEIDYSGNGNDMTVNGTPTTEDGPPIPWAIKQNVMISIPAAAVPSIAATAGAFNIPPSQLPISVTDY